MDFVSIRVSTLRGDLPIPFDVYIHIAGKNILYCRKGDSFEGQRLLRLKEKKLKKMYILKEDEDYYRSYLSQSIDRAYATPNNAPIEDRAAVIQGAQQGAAEDLMDNVEAKEFYDTAQLGASRFINFITENDAAIKAIINVEADPNDVAHHGMNVATIAIGICEVLGLTQTQPQLVNQMALGCMIHDIEHYHSGIALNVPVAEMSAENREIYRNHPTSGGARLRNSKHFDRLVLEIVERHEELSDGSGFPSGLIEKDLNPYVLIAATANLFDRHVTFEKMPPKTVLKNMLINNMGQFPLSHLQALQTVLKSKHII